MASRVPIPFNIFNNIHNPFPDVINYVTNINTVTQQGYDFTGQEIFGSITGARRAVKPFIIGFIPPDIDVNFIPVERKLTELGKITKATLKKSTQVIPTKKTPFNNTYSPKNIGQQVPTIKSVKVSDAAQIIENYLAKGGIPGDRAKLLTSFFIGQAATEIGDSGGQFNTVNYNFGNVHASGGGKFKKDVSGNVIPGTTAGLPNGQSIVVNQSGMDPPPPTPNGGGYYLGVDSDPKTGAYPVYFIAADNPQDGIERWLANTIGGFNGVLAANNADEFARALRPDLFAGGGFGYFGGDESHVEAYANGVASGAARLTKSSTSDFREPKVTEVAADTGEIIGSIMTNGNVTDLEDDDILAKGKQTGRNLRVSDKRREVVNKQITELQNQINTVRYTPALLLLVNPSDFTKSYEHTIDTPKGRRGHIVHMWIEKPLAISAKGITAGFYAINASGDGGLSTQNRIQSLSYRNLMSLALIYRNNGHFYGRPDNSNNANWGVPIISMSVFIYYDGVIYIGSFDDFGINDNAEKPFQMEYDFKFTVRYEIETNDVSEALIFRNTRF